MANTYSFNSHTVTTKEGQRSLLTRSFLYMFFFLLLSAATMVAVNLIFVKMGVYQNPELQDKYFVLLGVSGGVQLVLTIIIMFTSFRQSRAAAIPFGLYAINMGITLSAFSFALNWWTIASCFGIAALAFAGMAMIGARSKNASGLGMVGGGILFSVLLCSLFNILMFVILPKGAWNVLNIAISIAIVVAIMLITAADVWRIKTIAQAGVNSPNLALFFAFNLYMDFIIILVYILRFAVIMLANSKN